MNLSDRSKIGMAVFYEPLLEAKATFEIQSAKRARRKARRAELKAKPVPTPRYRYRRKAG